MRDLTLAMSAWPTPPEAITVPITLWYGALDTSPVHSPDLGATLVSRFPDGRRNLVEDEGGALLWRQSAAILRDLLAT